MKNFKLRTLIDTVLGSGRSTNNNNVAYCCPFCHTQKKKLEKLNFSAGAGLKTDFSLF